jgi:hypothetical protein
MNPNQGIDGDLRRRPAGFMVMPALAWLLCTWLAWAAPEAHGPEATASGTAVHPDRQQLETIIRDRYPQLLTRRSAGVSVVTVLFNRDGTLAATDLEILATDPGEVTVSRQHFARFGLKARDLSYIGVERFELPLNTVLVMFGGKSNGDTDRAS